MPTAKDSQICLHCFHYLHLRHEVAKLGGGSRLYGGSNSAAGGGTTSHIGSSSTRPPIPRRPSPCNATVVRQLWHVVRPLESHRSPVLQLRSGHGMSRAITPDDGSCGRRTAGALTGGGGHGHEPLVGLQANAVWRLSAACQRVVDDKISTNRVDTSPSCPLQPASVQTYRFVDRLPQ